MNATHPSPLVEAMTTRDEPPRDAIVNLVVAMVKRALLDAHPESKPQDEDWAKRKEEWHLIRKEAHDWICKLFADKPANMAWAESLWKMPYRQASNEVKDRRLYFANTLRSRESYKRKSLQFQLALIETLGTDYLSGQEAALVIGCHFATLQDWRKHGVIRGKRFRVQGRAVWGYSKEEVERVADMKRNYNPMLERRKSGETNGRIASQRWKEAWFKKKGGARGTVSGGEDNRGSGA